MSTSQLLELVADPRTALLCRLILGGVMLAAGAGKLFATKDFDRLLRDRFGVRRALSRPIARTLPPFELVLGAGLVAGVLPMLTSSLAVVLLVAFIGSLMRARRLGHAFLDCGCFGFGSSPEQPTKQLIARNLILLAPGLVLLAHGGLRQGMAGEPSPLAQGDAVAVVLVAIGLPLAAALYQGTRRIRDLRAEWTLRTTSGSGG